MSYIQWLGIFFGTPLAIMFLTNWTVFEENKKIFLKTAIGSFIFGFPWDFFMINFHRWYFPKPLLGISIVSVPLEEFLFGLLITWLVTYLTLILLKRQTYDAI